MRVVAQEYTAAWYTLYVPNQAARKWATYILKKLRIPRQYIGRRQGFLSTGDPAFIARYTGTMTQDQYMGVSQYLPYAPAGVQLEYPIQIG